MNFQALRYFDEVMQSGSIRKASERLNVAASAISRQIQNLEHDLGADLLDRSVRGVRLTEAGEILAVKIRTLFQTISEVQNDIDNLRGLQRGNVRIASVEGAANATLADACAQFYKRFPLVKVSIDILDAQHVSEALMGETVDIGIVFGIPMRPEIEVIKRRPGHIAACLKGNHPLANNRQVTLKEISGFPSILPGRGFGIRRLIEEEILRQNLSMNMAFESNSLEFIRRMTEATDLLGVLPLAQSIHLSHSTSLCFIPIVDIENEHYVTELCVKRSRNFAPHVRTLLSALEKAF
ncbi:LysR family transcriptional regulator [Pelagibacterium sediminicola]|uniref:LysR family transcriptional regulator n=1 Tax=Pelagibacterium sediminicola TaxID=2248761 RepID=UPI0018E5269C|nr:LysR family transcriptional regulator [Pelagibacterium sediminicola]